MPSPSRSALRDLRRTRQQRRLGDAEWFDIAYRVYLFALVGLVAVVIASDAIDGIIGDDVSTTELLARGPATLGLAAAAAVALGVRSGADGGPISVEVADIRHVLLSPISRRAALGRPIVQRFRASMFALALSCAIVGQFVARELEGSRPAWAAAGALFGALIAALFVAAALLAHELRLPRWAASAIGGALVGWQAAASWSVWDGDEAVPGPANLVGSLALWGIRQRGVDAVAIGVTILAAAAALALAERLRLEPLARRGELVTQLRFAATVQDLRTVVMLRRQLRAESLRSTPWGAAATRSSGSGSHRPPSRSVGPRARRAGTEFTPSVVWRRGVRSLRRLPLARLGRIVALAIVGGVAASFTQSSSPLFAIGVLVAVFLIGLEAIEPLSQEVDHPDRTDAIPLDRGVLYTHHLLAPAGLLVVAAAIGAAAATVVDPGQAAGAVGVALPTAFGGALGPVVATVLDASPPAAVADTTLTGAPRHHDSSLVPPEFAGFSNAFSAALPVIISAIGVVPVLAMRVEPSAVTAIRSSIGVVMATAAVCWWIRRRDRWAIRIREFFEAGRADHRGASA